MNQPLHPAKIRPPGKPARYKYIDKQQQVHHQAAIAHLMKENQPADYNNIHLNQVFAQMFFRNHLPALTLLHINNVVYNGRISDNLNRLIKFHTNHLHHFAEAHSLLMNEYL